MKNKTLIIFAGIVILIGLLLWWSRSLSTAGAVYWPGTEVRCLQYGHQNIALHIHPRLSITVDGQPEQIPTNIGITSSCMAEVHTHDATGELHIESALKDRSFTLADFFAVRGTTLSREGFTHTVTINGEAVDDIGARTLADHDEVLISYESIN